MAQRSNIVLGNDNSEWRSSAHDFLEETKSCVKDLPDEAFRASVNPATREVHWKFGDEKTSFRTSNKQPNPWEIGFARTKLDKTVEKELRKSHFLLGNDEIDYRWKQKEGIPEELLKAGASDYVKAQRTTASHAGLVWGHDAPETKSESQRQYFDRGLVDLKEEKARTRAFVAELKKSAFVPGYDTREFSTTNRMPASKGERSAAVKCAPQKSSICLGYDALDYHTETGTAYEN